PFVSRTKKSSLTISIPSLLMVSSNNSLPSDLRARVLIDLSLCETYGESESLTLEASSSDMGRKIH
ncbi:hypothetical protein HAX54_015119, partial [Datura stramonium]|nr:hypothetical protein [Datura stramonium]